MFAKYSLDCRFICLICLLYLFNCMCFIYIYINIFLKANKDYYYYYYYYARIISDECIYLDLFEQCGSWTLW